MIANRITKNDACLSWHHCDWSTYYDAKRDTENRALRSLKTQVSLFKKIGGRDVFNALEEKIFLLERFYISMNNSPDIAKYKISHQLNISMALVERVLFTCTLIMYYREYVGLPPLIY